MKSITMIALLVFLGACAASSESDSGERSKGMEVSLGTGGDTIDCPSRNSTCYANVQRMCGNIGVEEVRMPGQGVVETGGRTGSGDDPFASAERQRNYDQPIRLRCKTARSASE